MAEDAPVEVVTEAVEVEGKKWNDLSDHMTPIKRSVDLLELHESSFYIGMLTIVDAAIHAASHKSFQAFMSKALGGAATEFDQLGDALKKIAAEYDRTDEIGYINLNAIFGPPKPVGPPEEGN